MVLKLEPKKLFQKDEGSTKAFRETVDSQMFRVAIHNTIAEFVLKSRPTTEELEGVRRFLDILLNFGEKEETPERAPIMRSIAELHAPKPKTT